MTRRDNGTGSVGKLKDGRWQATRQLTLPDGTTRRVKREAKTRALALAKLKVACEQLLTGEQPVKAVALSSYAETWYQDTFLTSNPRPGSKRAYRSLLDHQILPTLGTTQLARLQAPQIRSWLAQLGRDGLTAKTISMARALLRQILDQAVDDRLIPHNPITRKLRGPKVPRSGGRPLSIEQARALLAAARGDRLEAAIRLALGLGLRRGEVCGLRWQDVDLDAATLTVAGQLVYETGQPLRWSPLTKTDAGRRTIRLPAVLVAALRWHRERLKAEHIAMDWQSSGYVFVNTTSGGALHPNVLYETFKRIAHAAGLDGHRLHDLRHAAASFLLAEGVPVKAVAAILGHARTATTLDTYGHLLPGATDEAPEKIARLLDDRPASDDRPESGAKQA